MQIIARIESITEDLQKKTNPVNPSEISSARLTVCTFNPIGTFEITLSKDFIRAGLINSLAQFEGKRSIFSVQRLDMDLQDGGRYRAWSLNKLPESLDSLIKQPVNSPIQGLQNKSPDAK